MPPRSTWQFDLLTQDEREQLLHRWNATARVVPAASLPTLFEHQAEARPDGIAVVDGNHAVTYATLNRRADSLAQLLRTAGVGRETLVGR